MLLLSECALIFQNTCNALWDTLDMPCYWRVNQTHLLMLSFQLDQVCKYILKHHRSCRLHAYESITPSH